MDRAEKTSAGMESIKDVWIWDEMNPDQFFDAVMGIRGPTIGLASLFEGASSAEAAAIGGMDVALAALHGANVKALGVARVAWDDDPVRSETVAPLSASGKTAPEILAEAEAWEAAWEETDPAFVPVAGLTLAHFQSLLATARTARRELLRAEVRRRQAGGRLAAGLAALDDTAKRWYAVATVIFDTTTSEGNMLRGTIPTTYRPKYYQAAKRRRKERKAAAKTPPAA